jgi:hypothetical protein
MERTRPAIASVQAQRPTIVDREGRTRVLVPKPQRPQKPPVLRGPRAMADPRELVERARLARGFGPSE